MTTQNNSQQAGYAVASIPAWREHAAKFIARGDTLQDFLATVHRDNLSNARAAWQMERAALARPLALSADKAGEAAHTPTPWRQDGADIRHGGWLVARAMTSESYDATRRDAAFIVRACNSHDANQRRLAELEQTELEHSAFCAQFRRQDKTLICHPSEAAKRINSDQRTIAALVGAAQNAANVLAALATGQLKQIERDSPALVQLREAIALAKEAHP